MYILCVLTHTRHSWRGHLCTCAATAEANASAAAAVGVVEVPEPFGLEAKVVLDASRLRADDDDATDACGVCA